MNSYILKPTNTICPVCRSKDALILWQTSSEESAQHYVLKQKDFKKNYKLTNQIEAIWGKNKCEVNKCSNCDFCYSNPFKAGDEEFYTLAYERKGYPSWKWEFQETFMILKEYKNASQLQLELEMVHLLIKY